MRVASLQSLSRRRWPTRQPEQLACVVLVGPPYCDVQLVEDWQPEMGSSNVQYKFYSFGGVVGMVNIYYRGPR